MADSHSDIQEYEDLPEGREDGEFELPEFHSRLFTDLLYGGLSGLWRRIENPTDSLSGLGGDEEDKEDSEGPV